MHGAPWRYDTFVQLIFAGPGVGARTVHRRVHPSDVAPTLSAFLGVKPPAAARGKPLVEVLERAPEKAETPSK
jgi:arylsulfatase A-like enzyme